MAKNILTTSDIMDLISDYKSEIRKLTAKITFCENRVIELERMLDNNIVSHIDVNKDSSVKQTRFRRKETKPRKPYPLSEWDYIILDILKENGRVQFSKDIYDQAFTKAKESGIFMDEIRSKAKINQCLVKLANRRQDIKKIRYGGRGFAYCLPEWIDEKGKLLIEFQ